MNALVALLLLALFGGLAGSGTAEKSVENNLRESFHPRTVKVEISRGHRSPFSRTLERIQIDMAGFRSEGDSGGLQLEQGHSPLVGKINHLVIKAADFEVGGLPVEKMELTLDDIRYDLWKAALKRRLRLFSFSDQGSEIALTLTPGSLQRFLGPRVTELEDFRLRLEGGQVVVSGKAKAAFVRVPIRISGRLEAGGGCIYLRDPKLAVTSVPLPGFITDRVVAQVNPLVDLNKEIKGCFDLRVRYVLVGSRSLTLRAALSPRYPPPPAKQ